eukprot:2651108-Amphidinium_carterae.1
MVRFGSQSTHGLESRTVESTLNATKVGPSLDDRSHNLAVTSGHHEVVGSVPGDLPPRGLEATRSGMPPKSRTQKSASAGLGHVHASQPQRSPTVSQSAAKVAQPAWLSATHGWCRGPG